jgi:phosphohistidine phosphatase
VLHNEQDPSDKRLLLLLRHSKDSKKKKYSNFARPLTKGGRADAQAIGEYLQESGIQPDCIVSSAAKRAQETAQLVAEELGYPSSSILLDTSLYKCKTRILIEAIQALDDSCRQVLVVGHNPSTIQTANHFQRDTIFTEVPKSGLIGIEFVEGSWSVLGHKEGAFRFFWRP